MQKKPMARAGRLKVFPDTRKERLRLFWVLIGVANFVAFFVHVLTDGTCAFPGGGRFVAGQYLVSSKGKEIPFSEAAYWFNYIHGVFAVIVHVTCMIGLRHCSRKKNASEQRQ